METDEKRPINNTEKKVDAPKYDSKFSKGSVSNNKIHKNCSTICNDDVNRSCGEKNVSPKCDDSVLEEEQPIDLTCQRMNNDDQHTTAAYIQAKKFNKITDRKLYDEVRTNTSFAISKIVQADQLYTNSNSNAPKKRGRKRKGNPAIELPLTPIKIISCPAYDNPEYVHTMDSRQAEVLMAAKSLFSKRTRTLYHWMYPNTPKAQLKSAVSMSWETLGLQEKEFYISQVLGRFGFPQSSLGFPQSSLMVNPQLSGLRGLPVLPPLDLNTTDHLNSESQQAVTTILENQRSSSNAHTMTPWGLYNNSIYSKRSSKHNKVGRPPGSKMQRRLAESVIPIKPIAVENIVEDFQDDPELRQEFEQFKWALHINK